MKTLTFNLTNKIVKEIRFNNNDLKAIQYAERQKSRLENAGYSLVREKAGFQEVTLVYRKENNTL